MPFIVTKITAWSQLPASFTPRMWRTVHADGKAVDGQHEVDEAPDDEVEPRRLRRAGQRDAGNTEAEVGDVLEPVHPEQSEDLGGHVPEVPKRS